MSIPRNIKKEHIEKAIDYLKENEIPVERYSYKYYLHIGNKNLPPKYVISIANKYANDKELNPDKFNAVEAKNYLLKLGYNIMENNKDLVNIKLYDIHGLSAIKNFDTLITPDEKYFYWDQGIAFKKYEIGDIVFWVNRSKKIALCTEIDDKNIMASVRDGQSRIKDKKYEVSAETNANEYEHFYRFKVIYKVTIPSNWNYTEPKTFKNQLMAYKLYEEKIDKPDERISKLNDLLVLFSKNKNVVEIIEEAISKLSGNKTEATKKKNVNFWWVNQGGSYTEDRGMKFIWAPKSGGGPGTPSHWTDMQKIKKGDVILNYANRYLRAISIAQKDSYDYFNKNETNWDKNGTRADIVLHELEEPISIDSIKNKKDKLLEVLKEVRGPFDVNGNIKQGYLYEFNQEALHGIRDIYDKQFPDAIEKLLRINTINMEKSKKIDNINKYIASKGFYFTPKDIANFYLALKTKPFVILAGISGTGKTQLARKFAEAINAESELIPVKPDWTDNSDLIGYTDLQNNFQEEKIINLIKDAFKNPDKIYFAILDEMNLARVEHYFSDFLSIIETRDKDGDKIKTDKLIDKKTLDKIKNKEDLKDLYIPDNFYIIGTVNMDETTHPFSRKVLDRANSIELNEVKLDWSVEVAKDIKAAEDIKNDFLKTKYINSKDLSEDDKKYLEKVLKKLKELNEILKSADLHFGYRVRDEVSFYMLLQQDIKDMLNYEEALDYQIMQKILPRIQGSSFRVKDVMVKLVKNLSGKENINPEMDYQKIEENVGVPKKYTKSISKLLFMLRRFEDDGFTSFWL